MPIPITNIGQLNDQVAIQLKTSTTSDSAGGRTATFGSATTYFASVKQMSQAKGSMIAGVERQGIVYEILLRYDNEALTDTESFKITYNSQVLEVLAIENIDQRNSVFKLTCFEQKIA